MERSISEGISFRLGRTVLKPGDEDALYQQIDAETAKRYVDQGKLAGDWSGAKGEYRAEQAQLREKQRAEMDAIVMARRRVAAASPPKVDADQGSEQDVFVKPFTLRSLSGGWYTLNDANDDPYAKDGRIVKVQGEEEAQRLLDELNAT